MNVEICRICCTKENLKNILTECGEEIVEQLRVCANIKIDAFDVLPKFICIECENGLGFSYRLRKRGEETEKRLRQNLKCESNSNDDVVSQEVLDEQELDDSLNDSSSNIEDYKFAYEIETIEELTEENSSDPIEQSFRELIEVERAEQPLQVREENEAEDPKKDDNDVIASENECGVKIRTESTQHLKTHNVQRQKPSKQDVSYPCPQCDKTYTNVGNMMRHIRAAHENYKKFQCSECGESFSRPDILKLHMAKHTENRAFDCPVCKKSFKTNQSLHYHKKTHNPQRGQRPKAPKIKMKSQPKIQILVCEYCNKISHRRSTHLNHVRTHTGEKPFKCKICLKPFRTSHARVCHELVHADKRPHECQVCGAAFRQICHLKSHMLTHTGDKNHVCEVCQKAFAMRSNLVVHMRTHTKEMAYACNKCPKKFLMSKQFKRHKLSHVDGENLQKEACSDNQTDFESEFRVSQIGLYIDDIIETNPDGFEDDVVVSE